VCEHCSAFTEQRWEWPLTVLPVGILSLAFCVSVLLSFSLSISRKDTPSLVKTVFLLSSIKCSLPACIQPSICFDMCHLLGFSKKVLLYNICVMHNSFTLLCRSQDTKPTLLSQGEWVYLLFSLWTLKNPFHFPAEIMFSVNISPKEDNHSADKPS